MEDRIRLRVLGLSYSQLQTGAYALLLAQEDGPYRIPVVIGAAEAQSIAIKMEGIPTQRPLTHDLFVSFAHAFGVKLREVFIYRFEDGIFSSELTFSDGERQIVLDARTSDAIAIALRTHAPIFTTKAILSETGFIFGDDILNEEPTDEEACNGIEADSVAEDDTSSRYPEDSYHAEAKVENYTIEELERTLEKLIESENYEEAARISEILNKKKNKGNDFDKQH